MNEVEFRNSSRRDELRALLDQPALKLALEIIAEGAKSRGGVQAAQFVPYDSLIAHKYHRQAGIQSTLDALVRMTEPNPPAAPDDAEDQFTHGLPEAMKEARRQQRLQNQT